MFYSVIKGNNANTWSFGGEYLQTYKPYGEKGRIPVAQFTGEVGYNLHIISNYSQTFHLYGGVSALGGYETVNWGKQVLKDGATIGANNAFIYSGALTVATDFYLSDHSFSVPLSRSVSCSVTTPTTSLLSSVSMSNL